MDVYVWTLCERWFKGLNHFPKEVFLMLSNIDEFNAHEYEWQHNGKDLCRNLFDFLCDKSHTHTHTAWLLLEKTAL